MRHAPRVHTEANPSRFTIQQGYTDGRGPWGSGSGSREWIGAAKVEHRRQHRRRHRWGEREPFHHLPKSRVFRNSRRPPAPNLGAPATNPTTIFCVGVLSISTGACGGGVGGRRCWCLPFFRWRRGGEGSHHHEEQQQQQQADWTLPQGPHLWPGLGGGGCSI
jgi:hypothetical protein